MAASLGALAPVENSLEKGVDVNTKNKQGRTLLLNAKEKGHTKIIELLHKHGAKE